ncbi:MAG: glycosyltransferase family 39 protein, partial [Planctomycetia bacterium]|nr:glycosyltransferase family 39 protein [Planctomycetia bacterium]
MDFPPSRRRLLVAAAGIVLLYLLSVTGRWWPTPDSALYLGLGRSLAEGQGYLFNGVPSSSASPGLPVILAALRLLFGPGFWAPNLLMALCGLAALYLNYLFLARLRNRRMAFAVTLATAFCYSFYLRAHNILTDMPFLLLLNAMLYVAARYRQDGRLRWVALAAVLAVAGVVVRPPGAMVFGPLALGMVLDS